MPLDLGQQFTGLCDDLICLFFAYAVEDSVIARISQVESNKKRSMKTAIEDAGLYKLLTPKAAMTAECFEKDRSLSSIKASTA
jgi:hypothetical protein